MITALALSGVAEGLSITLFLPLFNRISGGQPETSGGMGDWIFRFFELFGVQPSFFGLLVFIVVGFAFKGLLLWSAMNQVGFTIARVAMDLRLDLIRALLHARWGYFVSQPAGRFANAIASEANGASSAYQMASLIAASLVQLAVYVYLSFLISWPVTIVGLGSGFMFVMLMRRLISVARTTGKRQVALMKSVTGRIVDILHGLKPIKAMSREGTLLSYMETQAEELNKAQRTQVNANVTVSSYQEPIMTFVMAIGLYSIITWKLMPFSAILVLAFLFSRLFNQVNNLILSYQRLVASEGYFISIRGLTTDILTYQDATGGKSAPYPLQKGIAFRNVSFSYGDNEVLQDVTIDIPTHSWTALVGPSGAGKTTVSDLVAGLYQPSKGSILLDDVPLSEVDLVDWRRRIGYVPQEMLMLHDSILVNVTLGETDITRADVEHALRLSGAWSFVEAQPKGMDTPMGERGARFSGGERQRIALARALVRRPDLLILDEASASLDPENEAALCVTLKELSKETTILAVSHQQAFARSAARIYHVEDGKVRKVIAA